MAHRRLTQSAPSYVSEREADESDLAKLERQFRIMDRDGKTYNRQAREQIHKQQQEIDRLRKEQEELHRNLGICKNFSHLHRDNEDTKSLRALLDEEDVIDASLIKEKEHQQVLDKEITDMQMKIANIRKEKTCINETQTSEKGQTQRAIRTLEIKLDRALTHFSEQLTKNSELRKELQTLHVEQIRFQQLRNRLEKELHDLHKKISGAVNCSIAAYDDRAEAQSKMILLKEKARKDLTQYKAEIKDLERLIAHECNLKEFMTTKCNERSVRDQWSKMKEQRIDSREESHDALEEVFSKIQTITGEDNLDLLVTRFIQVEDQKFALFNFVNDQNNEADVLKEQISQIQAEIQHFTDKSLQNEKDHGSFLADIEEKQIKLQSQTENYDKQAVSIDNILGSVKAVISRFFSKMEWDCSTKEDSLGSTMGLAENIMSHLGLTEDKTTELLSIQAFLNSKNADRNKPKEFAKFLLSQNTEQLQQPISFQPAVNSAEYEPDEAPLTDEEEWPISQEELRKKISKQSGNTAKLDNLYYIMVRERKVCNRVAQEQLNKQQQVIQKLVKEQKELKIDLNILNAGAKATQKDEKRKKLQTLAVLLIDKTLKQGKSCEEELDHETLNYLDSQRNKIQELKKELKNQHEESARLQLHRTTYPHKKVTNDLGMYIRDNMKRTTLACEDRTSVDNKIMMMKKKEENTLAKTQRKIKELAALFPEETVQEEVEIPEDTEESPGDEEEVQTYEAVEFQVDDEEVVNLEDLEKVTLDLLVTKFLQDENQKCELYTLICDQKNEIQEHNDIIRQIQGEVYHSSKKGASDKKGGDFLSGLRNKCSKLLSEVEEFESYEELINNNLKDIKTVIASILSGMGYEDKGAPESSLEDKIMSYLAVMEEKTARLLNIQAFKKAEASRLL
eukprot:XP_011612310.1 PREDICTED: coiled-coil domain-containing protein 63-like [Takifugu rubripes]